MEPATSDDSRRTHPRRARPLFYGGLALVIVLAAGLAYLILWNAARIEQPSDTLDYAGARQTFLDAIDAGRFDDAYRMTAEGYRERVGRVEFEDQARKYRDFKSRPGVRGVSGESTGPAGGDTRGPNTVAATDTIEDADGNRIRTTTRVVFRDSLFHRRPPPPLVEDFTVEDDLAPPAQRNR